MTQPKEGTLRVVLTVLVVSALVAATAMRLWLGRDLPLWLDETWTAVIIRQPTWQAFWREAWLDCNAPLYYVVMSGWQALAGESNWALRLPSVVFVTLAGLLPAFWRPPDLSREEALTWAALLCLWWPGLAISLDARAYGLLLFVSVAVTIAYARLLERPDLKHALVWCGLGSLAILTHYYAIYLLAVQGVLFMALRRRFDLWPAALLYVPTFGWLAFHLPRLAEYARPDVAWYEPVSLPAVAGYTAFLLGPGVAAFLFALAAVIVVGGLRRRPEPAMLFIVAASGLLALLLALAVGMVRPSVTARYLVPMAPAILLGLVLLVRRSQLASIALVGLYFAAFLPVDGHRIRLASRAAYGYERQSEWLMKSRPDHLVFLWDHPAAKILDAGSLRQIGSFFFDRAGTPVETTVLIVGLHEDPNKRLVETATGERPAYLWVYNVARKSAARDYPPHPVKGWRCMHTHGGPIGIVACAKGG